MEKSERMDAFITGSRAYGTPREDSDIDLVVFCSAEDAATLWDLRGDSQTVRYGRLNLVVFSDTDSGRRNYARWKAVTDELRERSPVSRDEAVTAFQAAGVGAAYLQEDHAPGSADIEQCDFGLDAT